MFDVFVATLRCPRCGTVSSQEENTSMQTHLRGDASGLQLGVGYSFDPVDLTTQHILGAGYRLIALPSQHGTMRLLEKWTCPACETEQWAAVDIVVGRIERVEAVTMSRATLESANFISDVYADLLAATLEGIQPIELIENRRNSVEILRLRLE